MASITRHPVRSSLVAVAMAGLVVPAADTAIAAAPRADIPDLSTMTVGVADLPRGARVQSEGYARFPGVVIKKFHSKGDLVAGGESDPILRVVDPAKIQVALQVPVDQAERIQQGQIATVQADVANEMATVALKAS